jgi:putative flippase GtrA
MNVRRVVDRSVGILARNGVSLVMYMTIGVFGMGWEMLIFTIGTTYTELPYLLVNVIAMGVAIAHNFMLNARFTFKKTDFLLKRMGKFYLVATGGIIVSELALYVGHEVLFFPLLWVKLATVPVIALTQFIINRKFSFGGAKPIK